MGEGTVIIVLWKNLENVDGSGTQKLNYSFKKSSGILALGTREVTCLMPHS